MVGSGVSGPSVVRPLRTWQSSVLTHVSVVTQFQPSRSLHPQFTGSFILLSYWPNIYGMPATSDLMELM